MHVSPGIEKHGCACTRKQQTYHHEALRQVSPIMFSELIAGARSPTTLRTPRRQRALVLAVACVCTVLCMCVHGVVFAATTMFCLCKCTCIVCGFSSIWVAPVLSRISCCDALTSAVL